MSAAASDAMLGEKIGWRQFAKIRQCLAETGVIPVPPGERLDPLGNIGRKALADRSRRIAHDDRIG
jgi:hypothetical protein